MSLFQTSTTKYFYSINMWWQELMKKTKNKKKESENKTFKDIRKLW